MAVANKANRLGIINSIYVCGEVEDDIMPWLIKNAHASCYLSLYEGFGLPPLEAMTCGTPTVVSDVSALPEVVGDAAILIDPHDIDELTVSMWRVLSDEKLRASLIAKGLKRAEMFSWSRAARETLDVYRRVVA